MPVVLISAKYRRVSHTCTALHEAAVLQRNAVCCFGMLLAFAANGTHYAPILSPSYVAFQVAEHRNRVSVPSWSLG